MTHSVQTSVMNLGFDNNSVNNRSRFNPRAMKFYQVDIEDFDNEVYSYEVEARNDEEAALRRPFLLLLRTFLLPNLFV